jgi:hypothetical protein
VSRKGDLEWGAVRSIRYHERRVAFFESLATTASFLSLITGSAAVAALLKDAGLLAIVASALSAGVGFVNLTLRPATRAAVHSRLRQRFADLQIDLLKAGATPTDAQLDDLQEQRLLIERDEPPVYRMLDLLTHNELCQAGSYDDLYYIPWLKRVTAHFLHWETNYVPSVAEHNARKYKLRSKELPPPFATWSEVVDAAKGGDDDAIAYLRRYGPWVQGQLEKLPRR